MRILCDMDGVSADFYGRIVEWYNRDYGDTLTVADLPVWSLGPTSFPKASKDELYRYFDVPGFWRGLDPLPHCVEVLGRLQEAGHDIVIVTAVPPSSPTAMYEKLAWVEEYLPFIGPQNFVATRRKGIICGDILFDDGPHNLKEFPGLTCAMAWPYNRLVYTNFRVQGWLGFEKVVCGLKVSK